MLCECLSTIIDFDPRQHRVGILTLWLIVIIRIRERQVVSVRDAELFSNSDVAKSAIRNHLSEDVSSPTDVLISRGMIEE